jgi:outer membrane protein assembly factor BamB
MNRLLASAGLTLALVCATHAADWLQFRGPQAGGSVEATTLFTNLGAHLAWKVALPGRGLSSPIVVGDRLFLTCASGPGQRRLHVICFRSKDGSRLWERTFQATGRTMCHEKTSVATPTAASDGSRVFAVFSSGDAVCLDLDGNILWFRALGEDYPNASNSLGMSSSPVFAEGVFVTPLETDVQSIAIGLDGATGTNRWKLDRPRRANWTSPVLGRVGQAAMVFLQSSAGVHAVEPGTGRVAWSYSDGASTIPSSAFAEGVLFVPSHGITALQTVGDSVPKHLWRVAAIRPGTASPVVAQGRIYVINDAGVLTCGNVADGTRLWQTRLKGAMSATPIVAGPFLYAVNEAGLIQVVDVTKPEGEVVGDFNLGETILGTPSIGGGAIYFRSDGHLWRFGNP